MKKVFIGFIVVCIIMIILLGYLLFDSVASFNSNNKYSKVDEIVEEDTLPKSTKFSLVMVGDSLIHEAVYTNAKVNDTYDFKPMLDKMKPIISKYDLAYYNQETILGGSELGLSTYPAFNSPYEVGDAFLDTGFNLISLANNHTLDRGERAILNSCSYWKDKKVYTAGSYCSMEDRDRVKISEANGIKYAMLSYTTVDNGLSIPGGKSYYLNLYDPEVVKNDILKYRDKVDYLMVAMHWGEEYNLYPVSEQKEIADYLSSLGVDLIIGTHPHVVEPIEYVNNTLVIYSLGNFLSAQKGIERTTGLMVSLDVVKDLTTNTISTQNIEAELLYNYTDEVKGYRSNFKIYPYTMLNDNLLNNYKDYYNKYMNVVIGNRDYIRKGDYSGNSE